MNSSVNRRVYMEDNKETRAALAAFADHKAANEALREELKAAKCRRTFSLRKVGV